MSRSVRNSVRDWRAGYGVVDPTDKEVLTAMLWHRQTYTSAATLSLPFFSVLPTTVAGGNMELASQLPNGKSFLIQAIRVIVCINTTERATAVPANGVVASAVQDVSRLIYSSEVELLVGTKSYGLFPTCVLPAGCGPWGGLAVSGTAAATNHSPISFAVNGLPDSRNVYSLGVPITIPPQYRFQVNINWLAALTLSAGNTDIIVALDGEIMQPRQ
jgi:hypothetical protein